MFYFPKNTWLSRIAVLLGVLFLAFSLRLTTDAAASSTGSTSTTDQTEAENVTLIQSTEADTDAGHVNPFDPTLQDVADTMANTQLICDGHDVVPIITKMSSYQEFGAKAGFIPAMAPNDDMVLTEAEAPAEAEAPPAADTSADDSEQTIVVTPSLPEATSETLASPAEAQPHDPVAVSTENLAGDFESTDLSTPPTDNTDLEDADDTVTIEPELNGNPDDEVLPTPKPGVAEPTRPELNENPDANVAPAPKDESGDDSKDESKKSEKKSKKAAKSDDAASIESLSVITADQVFPLYVRQMMANVVYNEANVVESAAERSMIAWTILNRYDTGWFGSSLEEIITAPYQFAYYQNTPITDRNLAMVDDVVVRWAREKRGETNVGRTLPSDILYYHAGHDPGWHNWFYKLANGRSGSRVYYDIYNPIANPYEN